MMTLSGGVSLSPSGTAASAYQFVDGQVSGSGSSSGPLTLTSGPSAASCSISNRGPVPTALIVTAKLVWTADYDWDTSSPPPSVDVLETGDAVAPVTFPALPDVPPMPDGAIADDGLSDGATVDVAMNGGMMSHGRHLYHLTVAPGQFSVSLPTRTLVAFVPDGTPHFSKTSLSYAVQIDNREVWISSPIEASYHKGVVDATHPTGQWLNERAASGSMAVDVGASKSTKDGDAGGWVGHTVFSANTPGFTNPSYSWGSDFNPVDMLGVSLTERTVAGGWFLYSTDKLPTTKIVSLSVQDGPGTDGATAANTYTVRWHTPYEAPDPNPYLTIAGKYSLSPPRLGPVPDGHSGDIQATPAHHFDWDATIDGVSVVAKVSGQEEIAGGLEIVSAIAKVAKPYTDVDAEVESKRDADAHGGATNGDLTWGDAQSENQSIYTNQNAPSGGNVPLALKNDPNGWRLCNMYIFQVVHYKDKYWYADGYNNHGYDGNSKHISYLRNIEAVYDEFQFIQYKNYDGTPYRPS